MEKDKTAFRITLNKEDVDYMNAYKEEHGASIQWFVERSVKERIASLKIQQELGEIEIKQNKEL